MSIVSDDRALHSHLDLRLQARAMVLALQPRLAPTEVAEALVTMAGVTPAGPIAARRALLRLQTANSLRPSERTQRAIQALGLTLTRVQERRRTNRSVPSDNDATTRQARGDRNR